MKTRIIDKDLWIELGVNDVWNYYSELSAVLRGGGNRSYPKIERYRARDLSVGYKDSGEIIIYPNPTKGLSFATTVDRLESIPIKGHVWKLPKNSPLPEGFIFNVKDKDHPLLNVSRQMLETKFLFKLKKLSRRMVKTNYKI